MEQMPSYTIASPMATDDQMEAKRQKITEGHEKPTAGFVCPGEVITTETDVLRGHGTYLSQGNLVASVSGTVQRVNKLVTVEPLKQRYMGEVGDVVIGRIVEVQQKKWKVDIGGRRDAGLMLSAINLPSGEQRRRTAEDELKMRSFFAEDDLISSEIQKFTPHGSISLHTRSAKYGKLGQGRLLHVPFMLVKRMKQHFHHLSCGVDVIFGRNGRVWVAPHVQGEDEDTIVGDVEMRLGGSKTSIETKGDIDVVFELAERESVCRVCNGISVLVLANLPICAETVMEVYQTAVNAGLSAFGMLDSANHDLLTESSRQLTTGE